jgi:PhnB protein
MHVRKGFRTLTPYPIVQDVPGMVSFMKEVFGAEETFRAVGSAGGYHGEVKVGDCMMMIGGGGPDVSWFGESHPMAFHIYVPDVDATYRRALAAGAVSLQEPANQPWGERTANVKDPSGNNWYIATFQGSNYFSEGAPTLQPYLHPPHSGPVVDFLMRAFGAEETGRATSPEGAILHTTVKIGDAAVEFSDAAGIYGPMPGTFYLYVSDADAVYGRALEAGALSVAEPSHQPYGDRMGGVADAFGNKWYIATHLAETAAA